MKAVLVSFNDAVGIKVLYCLSQSCERVDVAALSRDSGLRFSRHAGRFMTLPDTKGSLDVDAAVAAINAHIEARSIDVLIPDYQVSMAFLHDNASRLAAPVFAPSRMETMDRIHNKWSFYEVLRDAGLATPRTMLLSSRDQLTRDFVEGVGFPLLVKPLEGEAGHGIVTFDDFAALERYLSTPGPYRDLPLLLQQHIPGVDIDYSAVKLDGRVLAYDVVEHADFDVRLFRDEPRVAKLGEAILKAFDYDGVAHIDMRLDERSGEVLAIECNPRFWFTVTASLWQGTNFPALAARAALGEAVPQATTKPGRYYLPSHVLRNLATPWRLGSVSRQNWRGLLQVIGDPLPHLMSQVR